MGAAMSPIGRPSRRHQMLQCAWYQSIEHRRQPDQHRTMQHQALHCG